jgi:hypothetical protein
MPEQRCVLATKLVTWATQKPLPWPEGALDLVAGAGGEVVGSYVGLSHACPAPPGNQ